MCQSVTGADADSGLEAIRVGQRVGGHGSAIAPSPPAEARIVELRKPLQRLIERGEIVTQFHLAEMMECGHGKLASAIAHAAIVDLEYGEAMMGEHLIERVHGVRRVTHRLSLRAAVRVEDQRHLAVDFGGRSGRRQQNYAVQQLSVFGAEVHELRRQGVVAIPCVRGPEFAAWTGDSTDLHLGGLGKGAVCIYEILRIRGEGNRVHAGLPSNGLGLTARERDGKQMLLPVITFVRFEVNNAFGFIHSEQGCSPRNRRLPTAAPVSRQRGAARDQSCIDRHV